LPFKIKTCAAGRQTTEPTPSAGPVPPPSAPTAKALA
jgi:hypothetical protein